VRNNLSSAGINTIDMLIGNAGISNPDHPHDPILQTSVEDMINVYETNCVGNLLLLQTFHSMVAKSQLKLVLLVTSDRGSYKNAAQTQKEEDEITSYRASKAGLNMIGVIYATDKEVKESGIKLLLVHPGK
jgi:NAD(P)-dependent dehydrogenase (short-subunit alcohol dehydrogenase family)